MRSGTLLALILAALSPQPAAAQREHPRENTVAIGGGVGFLASDNGTPDVAQTLQATTGNVDGFFEYYYTPRTSLRVMYGWASPKFDSTLGGSLRRQQLTFSVIYNWELGRFRPFAAIGGGAYFLTRRKTSGEPDQRVNKPGGLLGWGAEYAFRTFAVRSEMNVHILSEETSLPEFNGKTLTGFTWTFGIKVPF
jgi:opacity protein-like surface antigen